MSLYTATVRRGPVETRYDVRAANLTAARVAIAGLAGVDSAAVHDTCRCGYDFGGAS